MISDKFKQIEMLFTDRFNEEAVKINNDFTDLICIVYSYPPNEKTSSPDSSLGLDIVLHNADLDKADNLCLEIYLYNSNNPKISVKIGWGHPSGKIEERIFKVPVDASDENLAIIQKKLPFLISKLREIIRDNPNGI